MSPRAPTNLTIVDLIRAFMEYAEEQGQSSFPALDTRLWHTLFYALQLTFSHDIAIFKDMGAFTGNSGYSKNKKLSEAMKEVAHICTSRFDTARITLAVPLPQNHVRTNFPGLIEAMYASAKEMEGFFINPTE